MYLSPPPLCYDIKMMVGESLVDYEAVWRCGTFVTVLGAILCWEAYRPRRNTPPAWRRRVNNLALLCIGVVVVRVMLPVTVVSVAGYAHMAGWGLFNTLEIDGLYVCVLSYVLLDLAIYAQHVMLHTQPFLWRIHRVHHTDSVFDATTALRFHPLEIIVSAGWKMLVIVLLGAPVTAVIFFEVVLNGVSLFNHGNVRIAAGVDRVLRLVIVTPDMHRVHHSVNAAETNSNYGFSLPWWDRLFRTYTPQPAGGHQVMQIGLTGFYGERVVGLRGLLGEPLGN